MVYSVMSSASIKEQGEAYQALHDSSPVHYDETEDCFYLTRYDDVVAMLKQPAIYTTRFGLSLGRSSLASDYPFPMLMLEDGGSHAALRAFIQKPMSPAATAPVLDSLRDFLPSVINRLRDLSEFDLIVDVAAPVALHSIFDLIGVPVADRNMLSDQVRPMLMREPTMEIERFDFDLVDKDMIGHGEELFRYFFDFAARLAERQPASAIGHASRVIINGNSPSLRDLQGLAWLFLIAGVDDLTKTIASVILDAQRELAQFCRAGTQGDAGLDRFIAESLRLFPSTRFTRRTVTQPVTIHGKVLPSGAAVLGLFEAANRDASRFPNPDVFDAGRRNATTALSFGVGHHVCPARNIAPKIIREVVRTFWSAFPTAWLDEKRARYMRIHNIHGYYRIPVISR